MYVLLTYSRNQKSRRIQILGIFVSKIFYWQYYWIELTELEHLKSLVVLQPISKKKGGGAQDSIARRYTLYIWISESLLDSVKIHWTRG